MQLVAGSILRAATGRHKMKPKTVHQLTTLVSNTLGIGTAGKKAITVEMEDKSVIVAMLQCCTRKIGFKCTRSTPTFMLGYRTYNH